MSSGTRLAVDARFLPLSIIRALWKRRLLILSIALLGTGAAIGFVTTLPPVYIASAVILAESQKIPENFVAATVQTALEAQLDTLKRQVLSRDRLWSLVEEHGLYVQQRSWMSKDEVVDVMRHDLAITLSRGWSARGPGAFQVEYATGRPETAAAVANQIGMFFITENLRQRTAEATETSKFLDEQLAAAEARLRDQEKKLKEFKLAYNGELPEQEAALLAGVGQSRTELAGLQEALARAQQNRLILESSLAYAEANRRQRQELLRRDAQSRRADGDAARNMPQPPTALEQAEEELTRLRARYMDTHPEVQRMLIEVRRLRQEESPRTPAAASGSSSRGIQSAASDTPARTAEDMAERSRIQELHSQISLVEQELKGLEERRERILRDVADAQARIRNLPVREQQLAVITRDYDTSKVNYQSLLNKKLNADVAAEMERWHKSQKLVMLDPARPPQKPARPRRALLSAGGAAVSLALGALLGFLLEFRKNVILGEWELPADLPALGRIPRMRVRSA